MKALITDMVKSLVNKPDEISVTEYERKQITFFKLKVAPTDLSKIIGKQSAIIRAIRTILSASGTRMGKCFILEIV